MPIISSFKSLENKHDVYRGKDCLKKFCRSLIGQAMEIINFKKKKIKLLTNEQQKPYEIAKICYICKENPEDKSAKDKKIVRDPEHFTEE